MARFPALMLWTDAWLADTGHLTRSERGTYMDLLILMWRTPGCSVPNDDAWLGKHLRMTPEEIKIELQSLISEFCQTDGNRIFQKRLVNEYKRARKNSHAQSVRAKSLWNNKKGQCPLEPHLVLSDSKDLLYRARARGATREEKAKKNGFEKNALWKSSHLRTEEPAAERQGDKDRSQRPTYQELQAKYGTNWGLSKSDKP